MGALDDLAAQAKDTPKLDCLERRFGSQMHARSE